MIWTDSASTPGCRKLPQRGALLGAALLPRGNAGLIAGGEDLQRGISPRCAENSQGEAVLCLFSLAKRNI